MSVYVDDMEAPYGRMIMCHMVADTHQELMAMASDLGLRHRYIQKAGTPEEHFDISKGKRALAVKRGARVVTRRELVQIIQRKRANGE